MPGEWREGSNVVKVEVQFGSDWTRRVNVRNRV